MLLSLQNFLQRLNGDAQHPFSYYQKFENWGFSIIKIAIFVCQIYTFGFQCVAKIQ
jgi:hypothetical protein